jgi:hypothetical protein
LELLVDFVLDALHRVYFAVEEKEVFRLIIKRSKVESNPPLLLNGLVFAIELGLTEAGPISPGPLPIEARTSKSIKRTPGLIGPRIIRTHLLLIFLRILIKNNILNFNLTIAIATIAFVRDDIVAYCREALLIATDVCVVCGE